jgi:hypothetical protein
MDEIHSFSSILCSQEGVQKWSLDNELYESPMEFFLN